MVLKKHHKVVKVSIVGDVMIGGILSSNIEKYRNIFLSDEVRKYLEADIIFCNLECPLTTTGSPIERDKIVIHAKESSIELLKNAGFNVVSLANNHIMDFGYGSVTKTMKLLKKNNIKYTGAGQTLCEARKPVIFNKNNLKVAFLAYTSPETWGGWNQRRQQTHKDWIAESDKPGVAPFDLELIQEDITKLKKTSDFLIISVHWGIEYTRFPHPEIISDAHKIIDMGANMIVGHHPHILQGYEQYHNGFIMYSLSNFLFSPYYLKGEPIKWRQKSRESIIIRCDLSKNKILNYELTPVIQKKNDPVVIAPPPRIKNKILLRMKFLSNEYKKSNYDKRYFELKSKENRFKYVKLSLETMKTYGLTYTLKKGIKKLPKVLKK